MGGNPQMGGNLIGKTFWGVKKIVGEIFQGTRFWGLLKWNRLHAPWESEDPLWRTQYLMFMLSMFVHLEFHYRWINPQYMDESQFLSFQT